MYGPIANGVFNIFKTTRNDFKDFVDLYFDESKPIIYSEDGGLLKQLSTYERLRDDTDINFGYDNSDSTLTPTACDQQMVAMSLLPTYRARDLRWCLQP